MHVEFAVVLSFMALVSKKLCQLPSHGAFRVLGGVYDIDIDSTSHPVPIRHSHAGGALGTPGAAVLAHVEAGAWPHTVSVYSNHWLCANPCWYLLAVF